MKKSSIVFELTDREIRAFWFLIPSFSKKLIQNSTTVKFDRIPISKGVMEQGTVRDEKSLIDVLSDYRLKHQGPLDKVYLAVSMQQGFIGTYDLPWLSKGDRESAIALLVDEEIPISRADLFYDFITLTEDKPKRLQILFGAARRSILEQYAFIFSRAGFQLKGIDFAYSVLGQACGFDSAEDVLYLQEEYECIHMILFRGVVPKSLRTLPFPFSRVQSVRRETESSEEWKSEIGRFLLYYQTQHPDCNLKRLVWSGGFTVSRLAQEVSALNPNLLFEEAVFKDIPESWQKVREENSGVGLAAMGYGQRIIAHGPGLNLWRQSAAKEKVKKTYLRLGFAASIVLMAGILSWVSLSRMILPLQEEVTLLFRQGERIEETNRQQDALAAAWNKASFHKEKIGERLAQVQALSGDDLIIEQIIYKNGSISVRGRASNSKNVQDIIKALRTLGWEAPSLSSYKMSAQNIVEFTLNAKLEV